MWTINYTVNWDDDTETDYRREFGSLTELIEFVNMTLEGGDFTSIVATITPPIPAKL